MQYIEGYGWSANYNAAGIGIRFHGLGKLAGGAKERSIRFDEIQAASFREPSVLMNGALTIKTRGGKTQLTFLKSHRDGALGLAEAIRAANPRAFGIKPSGPFANERKAARKRDSDQAKAQHQSITQSVTNADDVSFEIDEEVFQGVIETVENRATVPGVVPRGDDYIDLDVVGESNYQDDIRKIARNQPGRASGYHNGFLAPEQDNPYDSNAVAVYVIDKNVQPIDAYKVGYLPRDLAEEVTPTLESYIRNERAVVPLLIRLSGGEEGRPSYGVIAKAFLGL